MKYTGKIKCSACGTSDVSHRLLLTTGILEETIGRLGRYSLKVFAVNESHPLFKYSERIISSLARILKIISYSSDKEKAITGRSRLIWDEAEERGIKMEQVLVFGKPIESYRALIDGKYFNFESLPVPLHLPRSGYLWVDNKFILSEKLIAEGIPAPKTKEAMTYGSALRAFNSLSKPVIIKPRSGSRGRHTTTNINTEKELRDALSLAHVIAPVVVVEEHLFGSVYRATVVDGKLVGFFRADPPSVTGDGTHTVQELIDIKNKSRHELLSDIKVNDDVLAFLERQNLNLDSVIEKDRVVNLSAKTGRFYGGYTREMLPEVHPKMHSYFERAGKLVDIPVAGFDLIIDDPTKDPDEQRWGIIECNSMPFIDLHYFSLEGEHINIAKNVWDLWRKK
ncbi:MAG: hypothetical protein NTX85_02290 [Candidatus Nomurabacteria bacterium]|nr:hypothetical protein [Candidatus Nomurabacteria bacterium]